VSGIIIGELYDGPIHPKATESLKEFLIRQNVPTITGVDCRAITRHIRSKGSLKAIITNKELTDSQMESFFCSYLDEDVIKRVQKNTTINDNQNDLHIALIDYGAKKSIKDYLEKNGATVSIVSNNISKEEFDSYKFDGAVLSNGPGDPQKAKDSFELINHVQTKYPTFGICLGHQILGLVNGAKTYKMKFGHRGSNHSVKDLMSGKVYLSSQNHSYAIDNESLKGTKLEPTFLNINDNTIEGFKHKNFPVFSVQFHPEANSGPNDTSFLFNTFLDSVRNK
ncbi:MAG: glutamine-hydrolyzing carbamoyl-phosphate synthase small subunit, partial [Bacteriovoracaceae bacterium]|nr:glutamine-hydrolyzing carbamoyl-phosphate synthase small subunit [Bacteriovoracaceae bacterium]